METKELKVGMALRVWQVVKPVWLYEESFILGGQYVEMKDSPHIYAPYLYSYITKERCLASSFEVKLIGKLTITKLK